jgi:hypothetical protein
MVAKAYTYVQASETLEESRSPSFPIHFLMRPVTNQPGFFTYRKVTQYVVSLVHHLLLKYSTLFGAWMKMSTPAARPPTRYGHDGTQFCARKGPYLCVGLLLWRVCSLFVHKMAVFPFILD